MWVAHSDLHYSMNIAVLESEVVKKNPQPLPGKSLRYSEDFSLLAEQLPYQRRV